MSKKEILNEIQNLPDEDKFWLVEETLKSLRKIAREQMSVAANELVEEYRKNRELTAFTDIDLDHFYQVRGNLADQS